ncbi:MAG: PorP/SprF family type IX secretion system membrane protein [Reichenbachiella sp.]
MRRILVGCLLMIVGPVWAQQNPQFSQYMFNAPYWDVAFTGLDGKTSISAFSRNQWLGYESSFEAEGGAPITEFLNFTTPLTLLNTPLSFGGNFIFDKLGPLTNIQIQVGMAYHWEFPRGTVSFGLRPSFNNQKVDFSTLDFLHPDDEEFSQGKESKFAMDLDAGVAYSTEDYSIGIGISHILRPSYDYGISQTSGTTESLDLQYNIYGEYNYVVSYKLVLSPSALIQTDINSYTFNVGAIATYIEKIWAGLSYRNAESIVIILGYSFLKDNSLKLGYSFDYVLNEKEAKAATSHELYLRFNLPSISSGSKKIIRTPRFRY